jgi:hypothetical protein
MLKGRVTVHLQALDTKFTLEGYRLLFVLSHIDIIKFIMQALTYIRLLNMLPCYSYSLAWAFLTILIVSFLKLSPRL